MLKELLLKITGNLSNFILYQPHDRMKQKIGKRSQFGDWKLKKFLGEGGNGFVWRAYNSLGEEAAIKILKKTGSKTYERFKNEIEIQMQSIDINGVMPILDYHLPEDLEDEYPWYVMPIAEPLEKYLTDKPFEEAVRAVSVIANILFELHKRGTSHRDIKPANILVINNDYYLGDFGLVDYPDKADVTSTGDAIGAKWTMAPEMRRSGKTADGKPADVYSLAKTLWILISGENKGFDGQYNPNGEHGLAKLELTAQEDRHYYPEEYRPTIFISPLDNLLIETTNDNPRLRPTMDQFLDKLNWWMNNFRDFQTRNPLEWQEIHSQLFPSSIPQTVIWEKIEDIVEVLNLIGSVKGLNHMFYPDGGGMDLVGAALGLEPGTIELIIDEKVVVRIKPRRLIFESFSFDAEWNYFRIETDELEPIGIDDVNSIREPLVEIAPLKYIPRYYWEEGYYQGERLPPYTRLVHRFFQGDFVIFQKTSKYNRIGTTYDGRHNQMDSDEFRKYISSKVDIAKGILNSEEIIRAASDNGISMDDVVLDELNKNFDDESRDIFQRAKYD